MGTSRSPLMSHADRQALIRKPFHITYCPPVKRWAGVMVIDDDLWVREVRIHANQERRLNAAEGTDDE